MVCRTNFGSCSLVAATVTLLSVHGTTLGARVANQYAKRGTFSFVVAPGKYFPNVSALRAKLDGGKCISGQAVVRAGEEVMDDIRCVIRPARRRVT